MPLVVPRPNLTWWEKLYLPAFWKGFLVTARHFVRMLFGRRDRRVVLEYPEQKRVLKKGYRGAPTLVRDQDGREKCVSCQLCEFICPPRAIKIWPEEIPANDLHAKVEKRPLRFEIDMLRCIYCQLCEEVCPEMAIFLRDDYSLTGTSRAELLHDKEKLLEMGGVMQDGILKWNKK
ncbi:MAG: NADH-quinone oxidoreductase subunit I [Verrucomicrobiae bacterium]|nr:NADH-quinone oxidoreductase subunit I [Verrucomicrobiae bacterium]